MSKKSSNPRPITILRPAGSAIKKPKTKLSPVEFAIKYMTSDIGGRYRFNDRLFMIPIINHSFSNMQIFSARQIGKSVIAAIILNYNAFLNNHYPQLYATGVEDHAKVFLNKRLRPSYQPGTELYSMYLGPGTANNMKNLYFKNGSSIEIRWIAHSAISARSPAVFFICFDEEQSIPASHINITLETAAAYSYIARFLHLGTPLSVNNAFSIRWETSKKYEWIISCPNCHKPNPAIGKKHIDLKKPYLYCIFCLAELNPSRGLWQATNPDGIFPAFRVPRLIVPNVSFRTENHGGILDRIDGPDSYPAEQFSNEILALAEGGGSQPISFKNLCANCNDYDWIDPQNPPNWLAGRQIIGSIDWSHTDQLTKIHSYTIYAIWVLEQNKIKCLYARRQFGPQYLDPNFGVNEMFEVFRNCGVQCIGTDHFVGQRENARLSKRLGQQCKVFEINYAGKSRYLKLAEEGHSYSVGKTASLDMLFHDLESKRFMFPKLEQSLTFLDDFNHVFTEFDHHAKIKKYERYQGPDDFMDLCNYARLTFQHINSYSWI